jgi:hypothetical protein
MTTATEEPALFEVTADERIGRIRQTLEGAVAKAETAADKAAAKVAAAEAELEQFDAAIAAVRAEAGGTE